LNEQPSETPLQLLLQLQPSAPKHVVSSWIVEQALGVPAHAGTPDPAPV
jgi:hypothetical protein